MKSKKAFWWLIPYELLIMLPIMLIATIVCSILTIIMIPIFGDSKWGYFPGRVWARVLMKVSLIKVEIDGINSFEKKKSYIFVANHQSIFDIFLIYGWLNVKFKWIMKKELRYIPLLGFVCDRMGHIFIDRSNPVAAKQSIKKAEERLINGSSIVLFPEGTRTRDGKVGVFKRGATTMAKDLNLAIIPLTIDGAYSVMPKGAIMVHPGTIKLIIHPEIETEIVANTKLPELTEILRLKVASALYEK